MKRLIIYLLILIPLGISCGPKSIPQTRKGKKKAEQIHKRQYEMHPTYKKKKR